MAVSIIPERNGISRLDEMMSGVVRVDMLIEWFVYCIRITVYVLQIVGVASPSFRIELPAWCWCTVFYNQLTSKVIHARSVQAVVYLEHVVPFEYFVSSIVHNNRLYIRSEVGFKWKIPWRQNINWFSTKHYSPVHVLLSRFCFNFILILSKFYPDKIRIKFG